MRALLTAFGPFPGVPRNLSQLAAERLSGPHTLVRVLPTEYGEASRIIKAEIAEVEPDICLCLGVAGGTRIRLEVLARNRITAQVPDNAGRVQSGPIVTTGRASYPSSLPLASISSALSAGRYPTYFSYDAGGYVCNHIFYTVMHELANAGKRRLGGFIHVPGDLLNIWGDDAATHVANAIALVLRTIRAGR